MAIRGFTWKGILKNTNNESTNLKFSISKSPLSQSGDEGFGDATQLSDYLYPPLPSYFPTKVRDSLSPTLGRGKWEEFTLIQLLPSREKRSRRKIPLNLPPVEKDPGAGSSQRERSPELN
jgi:hypothetical protein